MARKMKSMDGNNAAAHVSYAFSEVAAIYPITPSSPMADLVDQWSANGLKNIFGSQVKVVEMQSEAGAAGAVHGSLGAGALTTTYTASQGLLLMIPNMYKIAAEQLPCVFHVSARTVSTHALNIFGDHSDVMACRQTGFAMLCEGNVQEVMDLSPVAHLAALSTARSRSSTSSTASAPPTRSRRSPCGITRISPTCATWTLSKRSASTPSTPSIPPCAAPMRTAISFFQHREACNQYYDALPEVVEKYMGKINEKLGTDYKLFNYYGAPDADRVIIAMGSICDVAEEVIDYLNAHGEKVGLIKVRLYRPFKAEQPDRGHPRHRQEDRGPRPHQGARRTGRAPLHRRRHRAGQRRHHRQDRHRRPLRSRLQGHPARFRVRRLHRACQGGARSVSSPSASSTT